MDATAEGLVDRQTSRTHHYLCTSCACVCAHTQCMPGPASNCADISLSFASSLKPHDTGQRSQMAGCLPEMRTDDNEALSAVQSSAALSCSASGYVIGRRGCCKHTHTHKHMHGQQHAKNEALTDCKTDRPSLVHVRCTAMKPRD